MVTATATANQTYGANTILVDTRRVKDSFSRTASSSWGSASELGGAYTLSGGANSDYSVASGTGRQLNNTVSTSRKTLIGSSTTTIDIAGSVTITGTPTGAAIDGGVIGRFVDFNNYYRAVVRFNTDSTYQLLILTRVGGIETIIGTSASQGTFTLGTLYRVRMTIDGMTIKAKIWPASVSEPAVWTLTIVETLSSVPGAGQGGTFSQTVTGNTNTNPVIQFDDLVIYDFQDAVYLYRVLPNGTQTLVRNAPVILSDGQALFWDDEAPLNVPVSYVATNATATVSISSGSVTITGSGGEIGWLKDPVIPANDIKLTIAAKPGTQLCDTTSSVTVSNLGDEVYTNNTGVFDRLSYARPSVVGLIREDAALPIELTSQQQADIIALRTLFGSGRTLMLQMPTAYGWAIDRFGTDYFTADDVTLRRPKLDSLKHNQRMTAFTARLADSPAFVSTNLTGSNGIGVGKATYAQMKASGATYATLKATTRTYVELAQGLGY